MAYVCVRRVPACVRILGYALWTWMCTHVGTLRTHTQAMRTRACVRMNWWTWMRTHEEWVRMLEGWLHTHAWRMHMHECRWNGFFDSFSLPWIKTLPKHVPTPPRTLGFFSEPIPQQKPSIYKSKNILNRRLEQNLKMRNIWKTYQSVPCTLWEMVLWLEDQRRGLC